jgi:membrane protein DedA with SNARE-associated domain
MSLYALIQQYGYIVLVIGTFLEGETVLLMAGFAAHCGYLSLRWVILWAFVGSFLGDQVWFYVGRKKGRKYLARQGKWNDRVKKIVVKFERYQLAFVLGFRFIYGLRNITPLVIGAIGFDPKRYLILNAISAIIWSVVIALLGYVFGEAMERIFHNLRAYEGYVLLALAIGGGLVWLIHTLRPRFQ